MNTCERLRPLLSRFAEGEADPDEALGVAKHLADCTVCKIVLARERRLHEALDGLGDPFSVDEEFSRLVMAALPAGPPPEAPRARRRGLRLGGLLAAGSLAGALAFRALHVALPADSVALATRVDIETGSSLLEGLARLTGAAVVLIGRAAVGIPAPFSAAGGPFHVGVGPWLAAGALLAAGAFLAGTTWWVARRPRESGEAPGPGGRSH